ncbi:hypothetical protein ACUXKK_005079, partial [Klebsiella aerogenes]
QNPQHPDKSPAESRSGVFLRAQPGLRTLCSCITA